MECLLEEIQQCITSLVQQAIYRQNEEITKYNQMHFLPLDKTVGIQF